MPAARTVVTVLAAVAFAAAAAACGSGESSQPTATPDPNLAGRWEYAGYEVDGNDLTVLVRNIGAADVDASLDDVASPSNAPGAAGPGIRRYEFKDVSAGRHVLRLTDPAGLTHIRGVWAAQPRLPALAPGQKRLMKTGDGFEVAGAGLRVLFTGVFGDSRCPVNVTCIQAGEVTLIMAAFPDDAPVIEQTIRVPNGAAGGELITKYLVTVHSVTPPRVEGVQPDFAAYEIEVSYFVES